MNREHQQNPAPVVLVTHRRARSERRATSGGFGDEQRASLPVVPESVDAIADFDAAALAGPMAQSPARSEGLPAAYRLTYACSAAGSDTAA